MIWGGGSLARATAPNPIRVSPVKTILCVRVYIAIEFYHKPRGMGNSGTGSDSCERVGSVARANSGSAESALPSNALSARQCCRSKSLSKQRVSLKVSGDLHLQAHQVFGRIGVFLAARVAPDLQFAVNVGRILEGIGLSQRDFIATEGIFLAVELMILADHYPDIVRWSIPLTPGTHIVLPNFSPRRGLGLRATDFITLP